MSKTQNEPLRRARGSATQRVLVGVAGVLAACLLASCSPGEPTSSPTPSNTPVPTPTATIDPNDVPPDNTDYSKDAGNTPQQYEYEPEPEPADSVVATLCNLNQVFFKGLRTVESGSAVADDTLRTNLVGLADLMDYWGPLKAQFPESSGDIDTASAIYDRWATALLDRENDDPAAAQRAMNEAEDLIGKLPAESAANCRR